MKLNFVMPGDEILLLEDGIIKPKDKSYAYLNWDCIPKDTVLEVCQVYIRKKGWFDSSLTFKFKSGPGGLKWREERNGNEIVNHERYIKGYKDVLGELDNHNADYYKELRNYKTGEVIKTYHKKHEMNNACNRSVFRNINDYFRDNSYSESHSMQREFYIKEIQSHERAVKRIKNAPVKANSGLCTERVFLSDIINWEVEIIKGKFIK